MKNVLGQLRRRVFGLSLREVSYERRRFRGASGGMRERLEDIGATFLKGYHAALEEGAPETFAPSLNGIGNELRGFAFEGAAMGFALLDRISFGSSRIARFLTGAGDAHAYMVHVGVGWLWARLRFGIERQQKRLDPLLGWLAFDGWGFHEGFFHWPKYIGGRPPPWEVKGYGRRVFDQGLGRSFWFVNGGNVELINETICGFGSERQGDLWSGIGLAATYAAGAKEQELQILRELAGPHRSALAQGSAFAAKARERAGNLTVNTEMAALALCGCSALEAAKICDVTLENLPVGGEGEKLPAYEIWRRRIQAHFQSVYQLQETLV